MIVKLFIAVAIGADDIGAGCRRADTTAAGRRKQLFGRQVFAGRAVFGPGGGFDDGREFALQGTVLRAARFLRRAAMVSGTFLMERVVGVVASSMRNGAMIMLDWRSPGH